MPKKINFGYEDEKIKANLEIKFYENGSMEIKGTSESPTGKGIKAMANFIIPKEDVEKAKRKLKEFFKSFVENMGTNLDNLDKQLENMPKRIEEWVGKIFSYNENA